MLFSSLEFLYAFLPVTLILYFLTPMPGGSPKLRNHMLLITSLIFYGWGEPRYLLLMAAQLFSAWAFGFLIDRFHGRPGSRLALIGSVVIGIGGLMFFKYADFFIKNVNGLFGTSFGLLKLALPIGVSFYTFQALSYDFDLYLGKTGVQRNFFTLATYVTLFPQLVAGPIVRYTDVERDLKSRRHTLTDFAFGIRRLAVGLAKKVLIANVLGELVTAYKKSGDTSVLGTWVYIIAYAFHLYFDFSGYSDMAIGMGRMLGFRFLENFNYPYIARSISDFWRRWHISLSAWFRDYVYIPLGGNRVKVPKYVRNVAVVWLLTGFWHGADWSFIVWGLYFGVLLLLERFIIGKALARAPRFVGHLYLLFCVAIGWMVFDAGSLSEAFSRIGFLFGAETGLIGEDTLYNLRSYFIPLLIAAVGCTPWPARLAAKLGETNLATVLEPLAVAVLLLLVTACLVDGSFNPFIYFRF